MTHRVIPLEVTGSLIIEPKAAESIFIGDTDLMKAVFDFGHNWLESSGKLTLHDPLAAVSVFYPDICRFQRGNGRVETNQKNNMGATTFSPNWNGNVEVAVSVEGESFYRILKKTLQFHDFIFS